MNKILITGSAGFIDFHLVHFLLKNNFQVVGLVNFNKAYNVQPNSCRLISLGIEKVVYNDLTTSNKNSNYRFIKLNGGDKEALCRLFEKEKFDFAKTNYAYNPVLIEATKSSTELFSYAYSHLYDIPTTSLRFFINYGYWSRAIKTTIATGIKEFVNWHVNYKAA